MKLLSLSTIIGIAAASVAVVQERTVQLTTESNDTKVHNKGLFSIHEGAGINYLLLDEEPQNYTITYPGQIYISQSSADGQTYKQTLSIGSSQNAFPHLQLAVTEENVNWLIEDGYLSGNGSDNFWVAKNTSDPYDFTRYSYGIGLFLDNSTNPSQYADATRVKIKAEILGE